MSNGWHRRPRTQAEKDRRKQYASPQHQAAVRAVKAQVAAGNAHCWRCGKHLPPGSQVHAGHDDHDRSRYRGPECPPCNRNTAASRGARIANAKRQASRFNRPAR